MFQADIGDLLSLAMSQSEVIDELGAPDPPQTAGQPVQPTLLPVQPTLLPVQPSTQPLQQPGSLPSTMQVSTPTGVRQVHVVRGRGMVKAGSVVRSPVPVVRTVTAAGAGGNMQRVVINARPASPSPQRFVISPANTPTTVPQQNTVAQRVIRTPTGNVQVAGNGQVRVVKVVGGAVPKTGQVITRPQTIVRTVPQQGVVSQTVRTVQQQPGTPTTIRASQQSATPQTLRIAQPAATTVRTTPQTIRATPVQPAQQILTPQTVQQGRTPIAQTSQQVLSQALSKGQIQVQAMTNQNTTQLQLVPQQQTVQVGCSLSGCYMFWCWHVCFSLQQDLIIDTFQG